MTIDVFLETFGARIGLGAFMPEVLRTRSDITIRTVRKSIDEIRGFYVPRYRKDDELFVIKNSFKEVLLDPKVRPMMVRDVVSDLQKWDLVVSPLPATDKLLPIPVATDSVSGKTLILDSNHTLCGLLASGQLSGSIAFVELTIGYVESVFQDFIAIKR